MDRMKQLSVMLVLLPMTALAFGCSRHVFSEQTLSGIDLSLGYRQFIRNPSAHLGQTLLLGGFVTDFSIGREGTTLKVKPYTLNSQGLPERLIQDSGEFLARTDRLLTPEKFGRGRMVTIAATYRGLAPAADKDKPYRPMVFEIREIASWPRPAHYPYGYHYPFRIY
jgi:starvation-inducible outer membrane lipoprotein